MDIEDRLKVVFMGTPAFAVPVLSALLDEGYQIVGVYTQPDRPTGRGKRIVPSPVKTFALEQGIPVFQPRSLRRDEKAREKVETLSPDVIVVAAYGLFLPSDILDLPRLGDLNVHPSLLPRYRGPSPVASAILNGDAITGVTVMRLNQGMDAGPILAQLETPISPEESTNELTMRLFTMGAGLLKKVLPRWERGEIQARPQDESLVSVTKLLSKEDGEMDWSRPAAYLARQVRAYTPWPACFTHWRGKLIKIIEASALEQGAQPTVFPGEVAPLDEGGVGIGTGKGILEVRQLQIEGRRAVSAREFTQGYRDFVGSKLGE